MDLWTTRPQLRFSVQDFPGSADWQPLAMETLEDSSDPEREGDEQKAQVPPPPGNLHGSPSPLPSRPSALPGPCFQFVCRCLYHRTRVYKSTCTHVIRTPKHHLHHRHSQTFQRKLLSMHTHTCRTYSGLQAGGHAAHSQKCTCKVRSGGAHL